MKEIARKLEVVFFRTETNNEPVREWLGTLLKADKKIIGEDIKTVQFGWPLGMPLVRNLKQGLWEVRITLTGRRIARIMFFMDGNTMILVNGFIKKTQKTPNTEIQLARQRKQAYQVMQKK